MSVWGSMSYKPIQRDKLHETSAGRPVAFWYGIGFPMLYLCCCWLLVATGWLWVAQGSEVSSLTSVWLMIQWDCRSPGLLGTAVDWRLTCGWKYGLISMVAHSEKHGNVLNSAACLWIWVVKCLIVLALQLEQGRSFYPLGRKSPWATPSPSLTEGNDKVMAVSVFAAPYTVFQPEAKWRYTSTASIKQSWSARERRPRCSHVQKCSGSFLNWSN